MTKHGPSLETKRYQGAAEFVRMVHPKKKPQRGGIGFEEEIYNRKSVARSYHCEKLVWKYVHAICSDGQ